MAGKTAREAVRKFIEPLQRSASCVTSAVLNYQGGVYVREDPFVLTLGSDPSIKLNRTNSTDPPLYLSFTMRYRVIKATGVRGPHKVSVVAYEYSIDDDQRHEIIAYHWHPGAIHGWATFPHLHIEAGALVGLKSLIGKHLPTGRVAFEQVLWFAIHEMDVEPVRPDWEEVLAKGLSDFERYRTWPRAEPLAP